MGSVSVATGLPISCATASGCGDRSGRAVMLLVRRDILAVIAGMAVAHWPAPSGFNP